MWWLDDFLLAVSRRRALNFDAAIAQLDAAMKQEVAAVPQGVSVEPIRAISLEDEGDNGR